MKLFNLLKRKIGDGNTACDAFLAVVYCTATEGLSIANSTALKEIIITANPIDFSFLNPGSFEVFFQGNEIEKAQQLTTTLRTFAVRHEIPHFGIGVALGQCLVAFNAEGRFTSHPVGEIITHAMKAAHKEASRH